MKLIRVIVTKLNLIALLRITGIRLFVVKTRYRFLKKNLRVKNDGSESIGEKTLSHNLSAFEEDDSAFGCGQRMGLLIYPVVAYNTFHSIDKGKQKVLIVGCRTEDDIYWMKSYGFQQTIGLDLISYSKHVLIGDIHKTEFKDESFDVVMLGYMIAYTKDPLTVVKECRRILKKGGLLGIGIDYIPDFDPNHLIPPQENTLNSTSDLKALINQVTPNKVIFEYNHHNDAVEDFGTAVVTQCL